MKDIIGYEGLYAITEDGLVWSYRRKKFLKPRPNKDGYLYVNLSKNGKYTSKTIHRLVAKAFSPNPNGLTDVNHKDENKLNNDVSNLEWMTHKDNCNYGSHNTKLGESHSKPIYCVELNRTFKSAKEAAEELNLNKGNLSCCLNGKYQTTGGYHWNFI